MAKVLFTNNTDFDTILPALTPPLSQSDIVSLYASKHNPFVYFERQDGGEEHIVGFDGPAEDLLAVRLSATVPAFSFLRQIDATIQRGRGNAGAFCNFDPGSDGKQSSLNPALIYAGDVTVLKLVTAIHQSPVWKTGTSAIVFYGTKRL